MTAHPTSPSSPIMSRLVPYLTSREGEHPDLLLSLRGTHGPDGACNSATGTNSARTATCAACCGAAAPKRSAPTACPPAGHDGGWSKTPSRAAAEAPVMTGRRGMWLMIGMMRVVANPSTVPAGKVTLRGPSAHRRPDGGEPAGQPRRSGERARLRRPEELAILTKVRMNARHATTLLRALLVLTNAEVHR
ncbi:hypothetical protein [Streptomyces sp. NPDC001296]